jgi:zinc protease
MQHELIRLKNGLNTLFIDSPGSTTGSVQIWFRAGSALEKNSNEGIAHFLEHMFFKGTQTRPGAAIAHEVESFGGEINAFTSFDYTCYYINTPNTHLKKTADILMDMVSNPEFKQEDLIPERGVVFEEYRRSQDNPGQYSFQKMQKDCFTLGYAHPILGNEKTIKSFTQEQLIDFRKNHYNLENSMLIVSGDLNKKQEVIKTLETYKLPSGKESSFPKFALKNKSNISVYKKETQMMQFSLCWQAVSFQQDEACFEDLALNCLGHGESSLLYKELVLKDSLANSCGCSTMFMNNGGLHYMKVTLPVKNLSKVLTRLNSVFSMALGNGFQKDELQKIKNQYIASKTYDRESLESFTFSLGHGFAQTGDINSEDHFIEKVRSARLPQINEALRKIFESTVHISAQIPLNDDSDKIRKMLTSFDAKLKKTITKKTVAKKLPYKVTTSKHDPQVKMLQIKPGIKFIYRHNPLTPTFVLHSYIEGGLSHETNDTNGIYQLLSTALIKGYKGFNQDQLNEDLENKSAALNSFSGKNAYGLTVHAQSEHLQQMCQHFTQSLTSPSFATNSIKHDKELAKRTIKSHLENPVKFCFSEASNIFFHKHPYSMPIMGTDKSINKITRKAMIELHQKNLRTKEILITYCGDDDLESILSSLEPLFSQLKPRSGKKKVGKTAKAQKAQHKYLYFDREQTQIFYGVPGKPLGHKDNLVLKMLSTHLSGQSSDLFVHVRDRLGLCYTAQPVHFTALEAGYWGIYMASGHDKVDAAVAAIQKIIDNIKENGLKKSEFIRIKEMIKGQNLLNVQTNDDYANVYSVTTHQGKSLDYYHQKNEEINKLTYNDFDRDLKRILKQSWSKILVGRSDLKS